MTTIKADGETPFGRIKVEIAGGKYVKGVRCDPEVFETMIRKAIRNEEGSIANDYHPESNSMLQAFAYLTNLFDYDSVKVIGEL